MGQIAANTPMGHATIKVEILFDVTSNTINQRTLYKSNLMIFMTSPLGVAVGLLSI